MTPHTLLLVDDTSLTLKLLDAAFSAERYTIKTASDGQEAMDVLLHHNVDLIITDILMPNIDGYYLCYKVRNHPKLSHIPIIIYTATYTSVSEEKIAAEMGADLFVRKPAPIRTLLSSVKNLLDHPVAIRRVQARTNASFEVMHQYSSDLVNKLEQRNISLEEIRRNLEQTVSDRTVELQHANKELVAANEELQAANEELSAINEKLTEATHLIQRQSEIIILQKEEQLNRVLDSSHDVIWAMDLTSGKNSYISRSAETLTGIPLAEIMADFTRWFTFAHPDDVALKTTCLRELEHRDVTRCTYRFVGRDGTVQWMSERFQVERDPNGVAIRKVGVASNVTAIKKAEMELAQERNLLRTLIDNIPDYIYIKDLDLRHLLNNQANIALLGALSEQDTLGKSLVDYFGPDAELFLADDRQVIKNNQPLVNKEETFYSPELGKRTLLTTKVPLRDEAGEVRGVIGISRDITQLKQQEDILRQYQEDIDVIFRNTREEILLADAAGKVVLFNAALEKLVVHMTGKKPMFGQLVWDILLSSEHASVRDLFQRALAGEVLAMEMPVGTTQGPTVRELRYEPIVIHNAVKYVSIISSDITDRKAFEAAMVQYNQNLETKVAERTHELNEALGKEKELVDLKSKFVSIASHEFRTPLSTIALVSGFLRKHHQKLTPETFSQKLDTIEKQVNHMTYLLDDILTIGKSEAGKIQTHLAIICVEDFFRHTAHEVQQMHNTHTIAFKIDCSIADLETDEKLLRNILINLLTNAIKFSPGASAVSLHVWNNPTQLVVEVSDQGIGISDEDQKNLFTAFQRGSNVGSIEGTGLGLSIVKKAVDILKGSITLHSTVGEGTRFTVSLPLRF